MATVTLSTNIARPAAAIFDLLADVSRNPEWCPGIVRAERLTTGPVGPGAACHAEARGLGHLDLRITEYERPGRLAFVGTTGGAEIGHSVVFAAERGGTRVAQLPRLRRLDRTRRRPSRR